MRPRQGWLLVASALRLERRALMHHLARSAIIQDPWPGGIMGRAAYGALGGARCALLRTGVGVGAVRRHAEAALGWVGPVEGVVVVGIGGALDPVLGPGAVVAPDEVRDETGAAWPVDPALRERLAGGAAGGVAVTVSKPVWSAAAKWALRARTGAAICEMEGAAWAAAAQARGVPFAMVRAVADTAGEDLPDLGRLGDPTARWTSLARLLLPRVWRRLPTLARRARLAATAAAAHLQRALA